MTKFILFLALFTGFWLSKYPKEITGKWLVENVDVSKMTANLTVKEKDLLNKSLKEPLTNAVFDFKPDHHFYLSVDLGNMPKNDYWEYNETDGSIKIKEYNNPNSMIMKIKIIEKDGNIFFALQETPIVLKMHKKED